MRDGFAVFACTGNVFIVAQEVEGRLSQTYDSFSVIVDTLQKPAYWKSW